MEKKSGRGGRKGPGAGGEGKGRERSGTGRGKRPQESTRGEGEGRSTRRESKAPRREEGFSERPARRGSAERPARPEGSEGRPARRGSAERPARPEGFEGRPARRSSTERPARPEGFEGRPARRGSAERPARPEGSEGRPARRGSAERPARPEGFEGRPARRGSDRSERPAASEGPRQRGKRDENAPGRRTSRGPARIKGDAFQMDFFAESREPSRKPASRRDKETFREGSAEERPRVSRVQDRDTPFPETPAKGKVTPRKGRTKASLSSGKPQGEMRLNQYIARSGICSRREADKLIPTGVIKVNGKIVTELGFKVFPGDKVQLEDQTLKAERNQYVVLNKPKGYITTMDDPQERYTVMDLVRGACEERIYPVGRLDRNTTGVLLFTNDGDMATRLTHPKHRIKKIYQVTLDKNLTKAHMMEIADGITLDDGPVKVDAIAWVGEGANKKEIGIELHSGRNRVVRRIFEHLGYDVIKLDRVMFAGITKKDTPRGKWRILTPQEVNILKRL